MAKRQKRNQPESRVAMRNNVVIEDLMGQLRFAKDQLQSCNHDLGKAANALKQMNALCDGQRVKIGHLIGIINSIKVLSRSVNDDKA